ncbi:MAG: D-alanyl-D-alanine carboxypeptidase family protein [Bauldia sp.]
MRATFRIAALLTLVALPAVAQTPAFIVVDNSDGTVVAEKDSTKPWYPASVTKLMTAYVTFRALKAGEIKPDTPVAVSQNAINQAPSKMGFPVGTTMTVDNALKMMIVKSANDIAVAIAETVGGSEAGFIGRMNAEARRLGMNSTHYVNPNGLPDEGHVTTARDLAVLTRALWADFPAQRDLFRIPAIRTGDSVIRTHNTLLERYRGSNGMKTGFICASGFNVVATATRGSRTLITVVLGSESAKERTQLAAGLLDKAFGGWSMGNKQIASFGNAPALAQPVNMRAQVCSKRGKNEGEEDDPVFASVGAAGTSLEKNRFFVMEPVAVSTLYVPPQPDPPVKKAKKKKVSRTTAPAAEGAAKKKPGAAAKKSTDPIADAIADAIKQ